MEAVDQTEKVTYLKLLLTESRLCIIELQKYVNKEKTEVLLACRDANKLIEKINSELGITNQKSMLGFGLFLGVIITLISGFIIFKLLKH